MDASTEAFQRQKLMRHENLLWLIVAQGVVILPLLFKLPFWMPLLWIVALIWRLRIHAGKLNFPSSMVKFLISAIAIVGLISSFLGAYGVEAMVGFLVLTFILKLLELRTRKDGLLLLFIGFIAVAAQFLFAQSIWTALYACFSCLVLIASWQTIYLTRHFSTGKKLKGGAVILLQAIPLMLAMFIIMPRLGPLWQTPLLKSNGHTGFSDSVSPGDLSNLVRSNDTAFRVNFSSDKTPKQSDMYWRGLVLDSFDGRTWKLAPNWRREGAYSKSGIEPKYTIAYNIIVEPHQYHWLFSLATPIDVKTAKVPVTISSSGLITTRKPLISRLHYNVVSLPFLYLLQSKLSAKERSHFLQLPRGFNPKTIALAHDWRSTEGDTVKVIKKASEWYRNSFSYTLQPPLLGKDSVDEFLFTSKRGFCEHFASSFAVLMRAAGIPARLVVGYQGGEYNALQDYWLVTQANAHAWVEVWLEHRGWMRFDPTAFVSKSRIEEGINNALMEADRELLGAGHFVAPQWLNNLRYRFDAVNYMWSRWVLSYNAEKQNKILKQLFGGTQPWRIGLVVISLIVMLMAIYTLFVIRPKWRVKTPLQRGLSRFDKTCLQWSIQRSPDQTIATFTMNLAKKQPQLKNACENIARLSQRALYAEDDECLHAFIKALVKFPNIPKDNVGN